MICVYLRSIHSNFDVSHVGTWVERFVLIVATNGWGGVC